MGLKVWIRLWILFLYYYNSMYENTYLYEQVFMDYYDGNRIIRVLG